MASMTGRERLLAAIRHEEPDRVPISPRVQAWQKAEFGDAGLETCTPPPVGDFDLARAKESIGERTTIKGYVDLLYVVKHGAPELVEQTVREAMEIARPGGGFIIGSSDSFREGTPRENIDAYFEACLKYGVYE